MRNGADSAVFVNTGQEFDGSDAGARPDEAVSWGKIKVGGESVKVFAEATVVFPMIVAATFAKKGKEGGGQKGENQDGGARAGGNSPSDIDDVSLANENEQLQDEVASWP